MYIYMYIYIYMYECKGACQPSIHKCVVYFVISPTTMSPIMRVPECAEIVDMPNAREDESEGESERCETASLKL